jgi:hypothetical protein
MTADWLRTENLPWILSPRALRKFIYAQGSQVSGDDVKFAAAQLSKYVRAKQEELAKA